MIGVIGKKIGMSIILKDKGISIPVTIIEVLPNRIVNIKTKKKDGYNAIQVTDGNFKKKKVARIKEFRLSSKDIKDIGRKDEIKVSSFKIDELVNVSGISKGKGYQGTIKRWKFKSQDKSHGNSLSHRTAGSTGQCQTPGRVFKGKKMAGRMGNDKKTVKNLKIIKINIELNLIIIKGSVPGYSGSKVIIKKIMKIKNEFKN
ncbi:50S ribosomal protein L3 [Candidatus Portiera aleyrodidarum]|uniref:Large ribosomal subunit protein uL3 n=1 Tax=Candidatus Portiera aleyrodidarum TV TaxID=1297582 RepID=A0A8D3X8Q5_9GAMM|nr:50S ribosomal protein L3 [Candidatus Portiera aleyrodidarum]AGI27128.1 ribosomal protein L3 [Candidatus Portiera aleyrodidarum TV]CEI59098.1 50S ribosomal protein L3 [Candidatus Portiera aleyrodidarum]